MVNSLRLVVIVVMGLLQAACWTEVRNGNQIWACTDAPQVQQGQAGPACRPVGNCYTPQMCALAASYRR